MPSSPVLHLSRREIYCRHSVECKNSKKPKARTIFGCGCPIYARVQVIHPTTKKETFRFDGSVTRFGQTTKIAVEKTVESWIQKALQGEDPLAEPMTVADAVEYYFAEKTEFLQGRIKEWHKGKSLSIRKYADVLNPLSEYLATTFGIKFLSDVDTKHLLKYLSARPGRLIGGKSTGRVERMPKSATSEGVLDSV